MGIKIIGTGSYIPEQITTNEDFLHHNFVNSDGSAFEVKNDVIIEKFTSITGIEERRYAKEHHTASDLAFFAAEKAIQDAQIDPESLDYIIVGHNFGDVRSGQLQSDMLPALAARVKQSLGIKNPKCVAYDLIFGCPGWVEGMIQAQAFIKAEMAQRCLVVGTETLSRVVDSSDRDSMIFADGAGAAIVAHSNETGGILSHESATYTQDETYYIYSGKSYHQNANNSQYIKMHGRKVYEFALNHVPKAMKACLDNSGKSIKDLKKIFIHQANEKMDEAIIKRFYRLYREPVPENILPMSIQKLGNSSVATVPTLYDMVLKDQYPEHKLEKGDLIIFASVGAGMNINAITYQL
ncbi:MAG: ketoacyl-ACP synthase III [Flavobacteriaceae bacterium]|nr:ketoacyl-ACP synthase III [Flavobacteriaceae bacterium]